MSDNSGEITLADVEAEIASCEKTLENSGHTDMVWAEAMLPYLRRLRDILKSVSRE